MEDIFSTNSLNTIQKEIENLSVDNQLLEIKSQDDFDFFFDINQTVSWIEKNDFKQIALQFPDELLNNSIKVSSRLREKCPNRSLFILADTSYGSCCVDIVSSEHYDADALVHYGHSCLSKVNKLPVFYVFEKYRLDLDAIKSDLDRILKTNKDNKISGNNSFEKIIIFYDVNYDYLYGKMVETISTDQIYISSIEKNEDDTNNKENKILFSRVLPKDLNDNSNSSYAFYYIGNRDSFLNPFLFYFNRNKFFHYNTSKSKFAEEIQFSKTNKELMKRYYLVEKAKDARIFGILIGTMSINDYKKAVNHVSDLLKKAGRRYYIFLIGKLNCPKLNNFMEVDMYVLIACNENSLINSKELNKPIVTIYELEIAYNCARFWGNEFVCDYRQLLSGNEHHVPVEISEQESDVSLITGEARYNIKLSDRKLKDENEEKNKSIINRDDALSVVHFAGAGEYLKNRSWKGLEQDLGMTEAARPIEGKKGIAAGYEDENK